MRTAQLWVIASKVLFRAPQGEHRRGAAQGSASIPGERHRAPPDRQEAPSAAASLNPERRGQRGPAGGRTRPRVRGSEQGTRQPGDPQPPPGRASLSGSGPAAALAAPPGFPPRSPDEPPRPHRPRPLTAAPGAPPGQAAASPPARRRSL